MGKRRGEIKVVDKQQIIDNKINPQLDKALETKESTKGKKLHDEIVYLIDNVKRKTITEEIKFIGEENE